MCGLIEELNLPLHSDQLVRTPLPCTLRAQFGWGVEFATALRSACQDTTALHITCAVWLRSWIYRCTQMGLSEQSYLGYHVCKLVDKLNLLLLSDELDWKAPPSTLHVQFGWGVEFASALMSLSKQQSLQYFHLTSPCGGWVGRRRFARECFRTWCIACAVCWGVEFPTALRWAQLNNTAYHIQFSVFCPVSSCLTITSPCKAVDLPVCVIFIQCSDGLSSPCWHREKCVCINYSCILLMLFAVLGSFKFWCCDSHRWCTLLYLTQSSRHVCHQVQ